MKKNILFFSALILYNCSSFCQGIMTTCIGTGIAGYSGDNGPASAAELNGGNDICMDPAGNIYIADAVNNVIRRVSVSGIITTVAGNNIAGYSGDGGQATGAQLKSPGYICLDPFGNLYISEGGPMIGNPGNATIRKVTPSGIISTVVHLICPKGICSDQSGNVYVADQEANKILKISATGTLSTYAGTGYAGYTGDGFQATAAQLNGPMAVGINAAGDLFFSDQIYSPSAESYIRKINAATGVITTIAGNGSGTTGDGGPAINAGLGFIFGIFIDGHGDLYCNEESCASRKIDMATGIINLVAGEYGTEGYNGDGGSATTEDLRFPGGLFVNPWNGNLVIADMGNNRIRSATQPDYVPTATGIKSISNTPDRFLVSPNPSNGILTLKTTAAHAYIVVTNVPGQEVYSTLTDSRIATIDLSNEPTGIYYVTMNCDGLSEVEKVFISR